MPASASMASVVMEDEIQPLQCNFQEESIFPEMVDLDLVSRNNLESTMLKVPESHIISRLIHGKCIRFVLLRKERDSDMRDR